MLSPKRFFVLGLHLHIRMPWWEAEGRVEFNLRSIGQRDHVAVRRSILSWLIVPDRPDRHDRVHHFVCLCHSMCHVQRFFDHHDR